jgi:hypothetical protein
MLQALRFRGDGELLVDPALSRLTELVDRCERRYGWYPVYHPGFHIVGSPRVIPGDSSWATRLFALSCGLAFVLAGLLTLVGLVTVIQRLL